MYLIFFILHILAMGCTTLFFGRLGQSALTSYISLLFVMANIFVLKQMELGSFLVTCADAYIIGVSFGINLLQEIWGKKIAQKAILISFACSLLYVCMGYMNNLYIPSVYDTSNPHFMYIFNHSLRIITASFTSYLIVQYVDTMMYGYIQATTQGKYFLVRNYISMLSSQLFDTILFSFLGLYGIVSSLTDIMIVSYFVKVFAIFLTTPFIWYAKKFVFAEK
jgi:uncharacterized integral membrane protein (TIGR00697 family)